MYYQFYLHIDYIIFTTYFVCVNTGKLETNLLIKMHFINKTKLETQKQAILAREKEKERKARTRRLIQIGAIIESMGIDNIELAYKFKSYFEDNEKSKAWIYKFIDENK